MSLRQNPESFPTSPLSPHQRCHSCDSLGDDHLGKGCCVIRESVLSKNMDATTGIRDRRSPGRLLDLMGGLCAIAVIWPALVCAGLAVRFCDGSPVFFSQQRLGQRRIPFRIFKLRTMTDERITTVGRWLRLGRIDELPQLYNVVCGDMSLVGPRPITQADVDRLGWSRSEADTRWSVRPGLTGPTQLSTVCDAALALSRDCDYAKRKSIIGDMRLSLATLLGPFLGRTQAKALAGDWL